MLMSGAARDATPARWRSRVFKDAVSPPRSGMLDGESAGAALIGEGGRCLFGGVKGAQREPKSVGVIGVPRYYGGRWCRCLCAREPPMSWQDATDEVMRLSRHAVHASAQCHVRVVRQPSDAPRGARATDACERSSSEPYEFADAFSFYDESRRACPRQQADVNATLMVRCQECYNA